MTRVKWLVIFAAFVATAITSFVIGRLSGLGSARASSAHVYTLRTGDKILIPVINQRCSVSGEGGSPDLFCSRAKGPTHQVVFFRNSILVWKVGNPDRPAWSGKP
ncbi:MAG TPA: hypothetical protein VGI77_00720 [Gaiellaceae bacterium]|jgi:hypothetical protein